MQAIEAIGFGAEFGPQLHEALESNTFNVTFNVIIYAD